MPFRITYQIRDGLRQAPVFSTSDRRLAIVERDDLLRKGKGFYRIETKIHPDNMTKSEEYLYLVYEVRQLQKQYFDGGRSQSALLQSLDKEKELDQWNLRTQRFLHAHPAHKPADPQAHLFFLLVFRWRVHWKDYFAYKRKVDADPHVVKEMAKQCRDFEARIDQHIKTTIGL